MMSLRASLNENVSKPLLPWADVEYPALDSTGCHKHTPKIHLEHPCLLQRCQPPEGWHQGSSGRVGGIHDNKLALFIIPLNPTQRKRGALNPSPNISPARIHGLKPPWLETAPNGDPYCLDSKGDLRPGHISSREINTSTSPPITVLVYCICIEGHFGSVKPTSIWSSFFWTKSC